MCRVLIETEPRGGAWNMAVDEVLLESALERGACTLRWYHWSEPTVSLGYFQDAGAVHADPCLSRLAVVRRLSGGGAILHHHEWTYSCALPADHPLAAMPGELYARVHERIIAVLTRHGVDPRLRGEPRRAEAEPFLCFGRGDARDIVLEGHKIVGSAQRRRRGAVLQHGSLLLRRSPFAPEFPGLEDLGPPVLLPTGLADEMAEAVGPLLGAAPQQGDGDLTEAERRRAAALEAQQYRTVEWGKRPVPSLPVGESGPPTASRLSPGVLPAEMD